MSAFVQRGTPVRRLLPVMTLIVTVMSSTGCGRPAQVVDHDECFQAVDALWTAVTSKRGDLLEQTADELDRLHTAGNLSKDGHRELIEIVKQARAAEWTTSAKKLKAFMLGQRRTAS